MVPVHAMNFFLQRSELRDLYQKVTAADLFPHLPAVDFSVQFEP
jgi:hypothetical protein